MNPIIAILIIFLAGLGPSLLGYSRLTRLPSMLLTTATSWFLGAGSISLAFYLMSSFAGRLMAESAAGLSLTLSAGCGVLWWLTRTPNRETRPSVRLPRWQIALGAGAIALTGVNVGLSLGYAVLTPFLSWDSWAHWALIARHWVGLDGLVPLQHLPEWLNDFQGQGRFVTSASSPVLLPLLIAWTADLSGRWNELELSALWPATLIAIIAGLAGWLRYQGLNWPGCAIGAFIVSSVPMVAVHASLAGYADLWLAGAFMVACITGAIGVSNRQLRAVLPILGVLALLTTMTKPAGAIWASIVLVGTLGPHFNWRQLGTVMVAGTVVVLLAGQAGLSLFGIGLTPTTWQDISFPLVRILLVYPDWQLILPAFVIAVLVSIRYGLLPEEKAMLLMTVGGFLFVILAFSFTHYGAASALLASLNRTIMPAMLTAVAFTWAILCKYFLKPSSVRLPHNTPVI